MKAFIPRRLIAALPVLAFLGIPGHADSTTSTQVMLSYPDQAVRLVAVLPGNGVRVVAHEEPSVEVRWSASAGDEDRFAIRLRENHNEVVLEVGSAAKGLDLEISVPIQTSLAIKNEQRGSVLVTGLRGDQEIESRFGDIHLERGSGSAVLAAYHGSLKASFAELDVKSTCSFITFQGDIDLQLPEHLSATLSLTLNSVSIDSEFDLGGAEKRGPSQHILGNGEARIDIIMNRGGLKLRVAKEP